MLCFRPSILDSRPSTLMNVWHICISGFLQDEGRPTGIVKLWNELHRRHASADCCVQHRSWHDDMNALAELIWRLRPSADEGGPAIGIYAYSWGGWTAVELCRQLLRRGLRVSTLVLSDPVYRGPRWCRWWRALCSTSTIVIPRNVDICWSYYQRVNLPCGHTLVAESKRTAMYAPHKLDVAHEYMDDAEAFHERALHRAHVLHTPW